MERLRPVERRACAKRIFRPSSPDPSGARSIDEITVSVTSEGVIGPGFIASTAVLPAGLSAAHELADIIVGKAYAATAVIIRVFESRKNMFIGEPPFCWRDCTHFVR